MPPARGAYPAGASGQPVRMMPGGNGVRPNYAGSQMNPGPQNVPARPGYPGMPGSQNVPGNGGYTMRATPGPAGHLPEWLAQHNGMPADQQERLLRQEPGFSRLNPDAQQRALEQLHRLNTLPEEQRQRRLARSEALERLTPVERLQVAESARQLAVLAPDRQTMVRRAWRDLRGVPVDQRETVLNSGRYQQSFSPQERGILSNLLRVEPYEPAQP